MQNFADLRISPAFENFTLCYQHRNFAFLENISNYFKCAGTHTTSGGQGDFYLTIFWELLFVAGLIIYSIYTYKLIKSMVLTKKPNLGKLILSAIFIYMITQTFFIIYELPVSYPITTFFSFLIVPGVVGLYSAYKTFKKLIKAKSLINKLMYVLLIAIFLIFAFGFFAIVFNWGEGALLYYL